MEYISYVDVYTQKQEFAKIVYIFIMEYFHKNA